MKKVNNTEIIQDMNMEENWFINCKVFARSQNLKYLGRVKGQTGIEITAKEGMAHGRRECLGQQAPRSTGQ